KSQNDRERHEAVLIGLRSVYLIGRLRASGRFAAVHPDAAQPPSGIQIRGPSGNNGVSGPILERGRAEGDGTCPTAPSHDRRRIERYTHRRRACFNHFRNKGQGTRMTSAAQRVEESRALTNIEIAQQARMLPILDVARERLGIPEEALEP